MAPSQHAPGSQGRPLGRLYFNVGNALSRLKRWDDAIAAYRTCNEREPGSRRPAHHNLALAQWNAGDVAAARSSLMKAEELGFTVNPNFKADLSERSRSRGPDPATRHQSQLEA